MKRGKRPTRAQKIVIASYRLQPENWLVVSEEKADMLLIHKHTGNTRIIKKFL